MADRLFGTFEAYELLDQRGDPWAQLDRLVDFEMFREMLEACWRPEEVEPAKGGRPPYDTVMMFKLILIGVKTGYSDEKLEYLALDSLTVQRFLGLKSGDNVPDHATIHRYRTKLDENAAHEVFDRFEEELANSGYQAKDGQMIDSTFMLTPVQRNTRDENKQLKEGETPPEWKEDKATSKLRQKDTDAAWTQKRGKNFYGYKNHICADVKHKLIRGYIATPANHHDITVVDDLVNGDQPGEPLYADAAYRSKEVESALSARNIRSCVTYKRTKDQPLTSEQQRENKARAKVRARVEHIFGSMETAIGGKRLRCIGIRRASVQIGLKNLLYNMDRFIYLKRVSSC